MVSTKRCLAGIERHQSYDTALPCKLQNGTKLAIIVLSQSLGMRIRIRGSVNSCGCPNKVTCADPLVGRDQIAA